MPPSQLRKSQSVLNDIHAPISNQQEYRNGYDPKQYLFGDHRRTGSVKSRTSNGTQGGSGFLRNLFSNSSSTAEKPQRECYDDDYFSNQSIWTEPSQSSKPTSAFPVDGLQSIPSNNFGSGDYSHAQCEMNTTVDSCNKSTSTVQSDKSSKRTGFARLRSTFRMPFSSAGLPPTKSKDDTNCRNLTNEVVLARQLAFRRTNTDLCAESVHRLIGHHSMDGSPPPKLSNGATSLSPHRRSVADAQRSQAITALHRHHKIHQKVAPVQQLKESPKSFLPPPASKERKVSTNSMFKMHNRRSSSQSGQSSQREAEESKSVAAPLIPPQGRQKMDESVVKQCLAEIRNKRMQTTKSPVNGQTPTEMGSTQSKKHNELAPDTQSNNSAQQNSGVQGPVVFRNNHESAASAQMGPQKERFSVPNLTDHRASCSASQNENIIHKEQYQTQGSVRELASKLERHNPAIVPQVTNEGLVTPVMRRKQFGNKQNRTAAILPTIDSAHCSDQSPEDLNTNRAAAICMDANDGEGFIVHTSPTSKDSTPVSSIKQVLTVSKSLKVGLSSPGQPNPPPASLKPKSKLNAMDVESETTSQPVSPMSINDDESGPESPRQPVIIHEKLVGSAYPIQAIQMPHDQFQTDGNENSVNGMPFLRAQQGQHNRISKTIATVRPQQYMQSSPEQANILINGQESHSPVTEEPPLKRQSEYAQLSELAQYFEGDGIEHNATEVAATSTNCAEENMGSEEDAVSIAETDFNEPWDSNAWENLLDLAKFGDEKPSTATAIRALHSNDTIIEEDDVSCSASTSGCESEDKYRELIDRRNPGIAREKKALKQLAIATYYGYESESLADEEECNEENHFGFESDLNENGSTNGTDRIFGSLGSRKTNSIGNRTKNTSKAPSRAESQVSSAAPDEWGNEAAAMAAILASKTGECVGATEIADKNTQRDQPKSPSRLNWLTKDGSNSTKMDEDNGNEPRYGRSLSSVKSCQIGNRQPRPKLGTQISSASLQRGRNYRASHSENHNGSITDLRFPSASPVISPARLRTKSSINHGDGDPNLTLQRYVELLASDENTVFGATLHRFIECTVESEETDPSVVIRRVRQFLNGMKNYLVKNGELDLHRLIERETDKLNSNEFLNIDAIFEAVLSKILLVPIKPHLYHLMVRENTRNGELQRLSENLSLIRSMEPAEFGFSTKTQMPDHKSMDRIRNLLRKMQDHYSPLKKLDNLLRILSMMLRRPRSPGEVNGNFSSVDRDRSSPVSTPGGPSPAPNRQIHASVSMDRGLAAASPSNMFMIKHSGGISSLASMNKHPPVEDMIRWLVYVLSKASAINCEIEAWYMWELMPQQLLTTGDAAFYLSTLFSAVQVLKHPDSLRRLNTIASADACTLMGSMTTLQESTETEVSDSFLRIAIPNEQEGAIEYHTFPVLPQMNVVKLCRVIASQFAITNPEDYGLYILFDGFETFLLPKEYPHTIRDQLSVAGKPHLFAYKRNDARIAWPKNAVTCCTPTAIESQPRLY